MNSIKLNLCWCMKVNSKILSDYQEQIKTLLKGAEECLKENEHDLLCLYENDFIEACESLLRRFNRDYELMIKQNKEIKLVSLIRFKKILQREIIAKRKFVEEVKLKVKNSLRDNNK